MTRRPPRLLVAVALAVSLAAAGPGARHGAAVEPRPADRFVAVVLGAGGGPGQDDLSAYLLGTRGSSEFVALDAGTLLTGIRRAERAGSLRDVRVPAGAALTREGWILRHAIQAYLISHAHLDHVAGLILDSPEDTPKALLGLPATIDHLRDHVFNWRIWPNFADDGERPRLAKYRYVRVTPEQEHPIPGSALAVEPFVLSHSDGYPSTAFLVRAGGAYALYFGDTGPDAVERSDRMKAVWTRVAPLARDRTLRAVFLEASYPDGRPDHLLFGHLTPSWLLAELRQLARLADPGNPEQALRDLLVVVTHVKPSLEPGPGARERIAAQLAAQNDLGVRFVLAQQGQRLEF